MDDIKETQNKLINKLINTGWYQNLRYFVNSSDMEDVLLDLYDQREGNKRFSPSLDNIFRPFVLCHYQEVKVVFLVQEPYMDPTLNNGLAISIEGPINYSPEFNAFQKELFKQVPQPCAASGDLTCWARKGVFLYNTTLTCRVMLPERHKKLWAPFTSTVVDMLNRLDDLIIVVFGESSFEEDFTNATHKILKVEALPKEHGGEWDSQNIFLRVNEELVNKNIEPIIW